MSLPPQAGDSDRTLKFEAYLSDGTLKTDLVAADVDTLIVDRDQLADVTIYNETGPVGAVSDKASPTTTHTDGAIRGLGNGRYSVDAPDAAFASATTCQIRGTWTDGGDSGYFVGEITPVVGYDPPAARVGAAAAGDEMDLIDAPNSTAVAAIQSGLSTAAKLLNYVRLLARKDPEVKTDLSTEVAEINADTGTGTGTYDNETDSGEAIRDRGDAAWVSGDGSNVVFTPVASTVDAGEVSGGVVTFYLDEGKTITITVVDDSGSNIDMTGKTLTLTVEDDNQSEFFTVVSGDITGADGSVDVDVSESVTDQVGTYCYYLREPSNGNRLWAQGVLHIKYAG